MATQSARAAQEEKKRQFILITQSGERTAQHCLSMHDWKLEVATDAYFGNPQFYFRDGQSSGAGGAGGSSATPWIPQLNVRNIEQLFARYQGTPRRRRPARPARHHGNPVLDRRQPALTAIALCTLLSKQIRPSRSR